MAGLKPCPTPRCPNLTTGGPCAQHRKERQRAQDAQRGSAKERGYDYQWSLTSQAHLKQFPFCGDRSPDAYTDGWRGECKEQGLYTLAEVTDHIRPHKGDRLLFWDPLNRQSMCSRCNTLKAIRFEGGFGRASQ